MEWFDKFKVGQRVRVVRKISFWRFEDFNNGMKGRGANWAYEMDGTIGKALEIVYIDTDIGYRLGTEKVTPSQYNYWYPVESLRAIVGEQLVFDFMR